MFFYSEQDIQNIILSLTEYKESQILSGSFATSSNDAFGVSIALSSNGQLLIIGANADERSSQAANYNEGLVYIFTSGTNGWIQQSILTGSLANNTNDGFGGAIAVNSIGNIIAIGASGDEKIGGSFSTGLVYIFRSASYGWHEESILSGSFATGSNDYFGTTISMNSSGNRIIVGAPYDERNIQLTTYNEGLAYIFNSGTNGWTQEEILSGSFANNFNDRFGNSVSINSSGNRVVIGAFNDERPVVDVGGEGLAYVFTSGTNGWFQEQILYGSLSSQISGTDQYGACAIINSIGNRIAVSAINDATIPPAGGYGVVYIYDSGSSGWLQTDVISSSYSIGFPARDEGDYFGNSIAFNSTGEQIVIAAAGDENENASDQDPNYFPTNWRQGLVYIYTSGSSGWTKKQTLSGSLTESLIYAQNDCFGNIVVCNSDGNQIIVGAAQDEKISGSVNTGLVYIFDK